jgi:crossover junction endodeoxyribonuclease RuvC
MIFWKLQRDSLLTMIVLGIDPGIANTGYGFIKADSSTVIPLAFGCIQTSPKDESTHRLKTIYDELIRLAAEYQPDFFALEDLFFSKNVSSAFAVGEARGVIKLAAANTNRQVYSYPPLQIKQAVVGYGKATKRQVQEMVKILLGLKDIPRPDHAADALAVAICHARSHRVLQLRERLKQS